MGLSFASEAPKLRGRPSSETGFTLIEMSIVLVIIGLIVGGVLVGQTLIQGAQLRAQVTQFEKFNQAVNTFRGKYDCLPGDCANATTFWPNLTWPYTNGNGDGQLIDSGNSGLNTTGFPFAVDNEPTLFWVHLWEAGLTSCCNPLNMGADANYVLGQAFPQDSVNGGAIATGYMGGRNGYYWGITRSQGSTYGNACGNPQNFCGLSPSTNTGVVTPAQAQAFDAKIDDGQPTTGNVYTAFTSGGDNHVHPLTYHGGYSCTTNTTPPAYNLAYGSPACNLWVNMQGGD